MLEPGSLLGLLGKALCFLWPCLVLRWQLTGEAGHGRAWAGLLESFLLALLGLRFPATAHFGVLCSSNPTVGMSVPSRAVLGAGSSQERGFCWATKARSSETKWSSLSLRDQCGCIFPGADRMHKICVPHVAVPWRKALPSSTKPPCPHACPAQRWGRWLSHGRAPGAQISLLQSCARCLGLGMASCTLASFLNGLCFINCSQLPLLGHRSGWAWGSDLPIGSWSCSAGGPGNAAFPLVPSLTPWAGGTHSYGATLAMGFPRGSTVMAVLSLAGHWKAGEGTPQDAGALGEQVCRWEAVFCACLAGSGLPFSSSLLAVLGCAGTTNSP